MEKGMFKNVTLTEGIIHHLKGFDNETPIEFSKMTEFIGDNGTGKTSIQDFVAFVFTGQNSFGEKEDFFNTGKTFAWGSIKFINNDGITHELKREITKDAKGKVVTVIRLDYEPVGITELTREVGSDLFLSVLNPKYFINMSSSSAKDLLTTVTNVSVADVLALLDDDTKTLLASQKLTNSAKDVDKLKSENEKSIKQMQQVVDESSAMILGINELQALPDVEPVVFDDTSIMKTILDIASIGDESSIIELLALIEKKVKIAEDNISFASSSLLKEGKEGKVEELQVIIDGHNSSIIDYKKITSALESFKSKLVGLVAGIAEKLLPNVTIQLTDTTTTGVEKEVFVVKYKDRNINICSNYEQIVAGLEISSMLMDLAGVKYPVFIDNAESVSRLPEDGKKLPQIISLAVAQGYGLSQVKGDLAIELVSMKTMPRLSKEEMSFHRIIGVTFEEAV